MDQPGWSVLNLPAIAELTETIPLPGGREYVRKPGDVLHAAREPIKVLHDLREQMGNQMFSAQYLQNPIPTQGNILRWEWLVQEEHMPSPSPGDGVYQSWDMAFKDGDSNDYSVCTTWLVQSDHYYLMDVFRLRADFPTLLEKAGKALEGKQNSHRRYRQWDASTPESSPDQSRWTEVDPLSTQRRQKRPPLCYHTSNGTGESSCARRRHLVTRVPQRTAGIPKWQTRRPSGLDKPVFELAHKPVTSNDCAFRQLLILATSQPNH